MKRLTHIFLAVSVLGMLFFLAACKHDGLPQPAFQLDADVITAALEKAGLPGIVSELATASNVEGQTLYLVHSPTETYDGSNRNLLIATISPLNHEGERLLSMGFHQTVASEQIAWEDWKQQIVFATLLYGGIEDEEAVYQAFLGKELPYGQNPFEAYENPFEWEAQLPEAYCRVSYSYHSFATHDENGFFARRYDVVMRVNIYESKALYEKLMQSTAQSKP